MVKEKWQIIVCLIFASTWFLLGCYETAQIGDVDSGTDFYEDSETTDNESDINSNSDADSDSDSNPEKDKDSDSENDQDSDSENDQDSDSEKDEDSDSEKDEDSDSEKDKDSDSENDQDSDSENDRDSDSDDKKYRCVTGTNCKQRFCDQVFIPKGVFPMGLDEQPDHPEINDEPDGVEYEFGDETPERKVQLDAFCIDKFEVTWNRYSACVSAGACTLGDATLTGFSPMNGATHERAEQYCEWIGRRLCTEAEWERVANGPGPQKRLYPWGDNRSVLNRLLQYDFYGNNVRDYPDEAASVEGVYNLIASNFEFVSDYYAPYKVSDDEVVVNPTGPKSGNYHILRGGSWAGESNCSVTERVVISKEIEPLLCDNW
ncbi:MAG: SUMF1/EgtB/PvdO family nonheme iron enzyme [Proteobacteria bacterium]|nr:SUMF1/EgtB/PvdO family nonheme iron enzyme [Pseudomonadota bacterium]